MTYLIPFCNHVTHPEDQGKVVPVVDLDFSKAFNTISHRILLQKLVAHGLHRFILVWVKKKKKSWMQGPESVVNKLKTT